MNQRHPQQSSTGRRQQGKTARPSNHRRVHSYQNAHPQSQSQAVSKTTTASAKKAAREEAAKQPDEEDGMAALPQFCMTCERQIVNPGNSTLYCSRACQRRDSAKPPPIEPVVSPAFINAPSYFDVPQPDILPQRSPTVLRPLSLTFSDLYLSDSGSPTDDGEADRRSKRLSDATRYYGHVENDDSNSSFSLSRRPRVNRSSTSTLPSLSNTPSSSVGTAASFSSYRPLPSRYDPTGGHRSMKSAELVIPTFAGPSSGDASVKSSASTLTSFHAAEAGNVSYSKQDWKQQQSPAKGSLRQLFGHEAIASTPKARNTGLK